MTTLADDNLAIVRGGTGLPEPYKSAVSCGTDILAGMTVGRGVDKVLQPSPVGTRAWFAKAAVSISASAASAIAAGKASGNCF